MISKFFIERPVLANVIAILIVVIGAVAVFGLPVAQYPDVVPPTVQVTTRYPGASARTVIDTVALPIEQQVNGVEGMIYMQSYATSDGTYALTVTFKIGTDLNAAQILVQNRVSAALSALPQAVQAQGVTVQKKSTSILQIVTLTSPDASYDGLYLANYATISLKDELARLPGVGSVSVFGAGQYAMRIWLDPDKMKARGLIVQDVINALSQQNSQVTAGQIGQPPGPNDVAFQYTLNVAGRLDDPDAVRQRHRQDRLERRDHARAATSAASCSARRPTARCSSSTARPPPRSRIFLAPGANALECGGGSEGEDGGTLEGVPAGARLRRAVRHHGVRQGLDRRGLQDLVRGGDPGADRHPRLPAGLAGDAGAGDDRAGDHHRRLRRDVALGFTVNFATLFAIVLAIGIVVDDAIIVVEGAAHNIDHGMSGPQAAIEAMRVLLGPIIGITLVLLAVFLPAAFLPGLTGQMYAQFALVIAATALISRDQRGDAEADAVRAVAAGPRCRWRSATPSSAASTPSI